ncbi:response regulator [Mesorhizobium cantuariense]|uniref:Response regulator n=1 Tax=Mesorhizobium cantuariense TaxID=1300275 RepID=A0ABV7MRS7_9HYPH
MNQNVVLLVEDEALILLDLQTSLEEAGFAVVCAKNAEDAITHFDRDPTGVKALVTDIRLGSGASGWEIGRHARQAMPSIPVIYVSGDSASDWHAQGVPGSVMIQKPFVLVQIITALSTLLNEQPALPPLDNA